MGFADDLRGFSVVAEKRTKDAFVAACTEVQRSVVDGSELTGAVGSPVDTGFLKGSWIGEFVSETTWRLTTNVGYAPAIEDGDRSSFNPQGVSRPKGMKSTRAPGAGGAITSEVGGAHSVKQTIAGWPRILEFVTRPGNQSGPRP